MKTVSLSFAVLLSIFLLLPHSLAQQANTSVATPDVVAADSSAGSDASAGTSNVRIVRLSQTRGDVLLDRQTGHGFEAGFPNLPIAQGQALMTHVGVAEVEFEDNSSLRITPNSVIEFPVLERSASGATISTVRLLSGSVYVSLEKTKGNEFTILLGNSKVTLTPSSHIRLDAGVKTSPSKLAVFTGSAELINGSDTTTVVKKKTLDFNSSTPSAPVLLSKVEGEQFDAWDKESASYHNLRSVSSAYGNPGYSYGINDLNYYGSFANTSCGSLWHPYFTSAGWDPYSNGIWAWYPGAGYSWVSPYPWGWVPFHYGSWVNCSGGGWGWRPGGAWHGLENHPAALNPSRGPHSPQPPHRPGAGQSTLVAHITQPIPISHVDAKGDFIFRKDSAGIGVPRESFGKLNHLSANAERHGFVSTPTAFAPERGIDREGELHNSSRVGEPQNRTEHSSAYSAASRSASGESRGSSSAWSGGGSRGSAPTPSSGGWSGGGPRGSGSFSGPSSAPASSAPAPSAPAGGGGGAHR